MTRFWLVADDYGISASVNRAIRDLLARRRLSATSVMVVAPGFNPAEAHRLQAVETSDRSLPIGLHLTLTAPFQPLSATYAPTSGGTFLTIGRTAVYALTGRLRPAALDAEIRAQLAAFRKAFGRPPDFVDGHQHVHLLAPVADALLAAMQTEAPRAWVRQCARASGATASDHKAWLLDFFSRGLRHRAAARGVRTNPAFAGTYDFRADARIAALFPKFLDGMPESGVIMCHPGHVDAELAALDPLTTLREREYEYFSSAEFPALLLARNMTIV
jgi:predicted glycoside hydrolase/deacetylase ChbG (UPF0249 family)